MKTFTSLTAKFLLCALVVFVGTTTAFADHHEETETKSLYDRLGGLPAISVVVSDLLDAMVPDSALNQNPAIYAARENVPKEYLKYHVTAMVCQATGGPCQYQGKDMKSSHEHLNISEKDWKRMKEIFLEVFNKHKIPEKETNELMAIVGSTKAAIVSAK